MKKALKLIAVTVMMLVCIMNVTAYAVEDIDPDSRGTIVITMKCNGKAVGGGTVTFYKAGEIQKDGSAYAFVPTDDFKNFDGEYKNVESPEFAARLADYAVSNKILGKTASIRDDGKIFFPDLEPGIYLFVQKKAADGYNKAEPFVVSIPQKGKNGELVYTVDASPKVELEKKPVKTTEPTTFKRNPPSKPDIPKTGRYNWMVPIFAVSGVVIFAAGWIICANGKKENEE